MAAFLGTVTTSEIALSAATAKTVLQILAPSNHRVKVLGWGVFFDGTSVSNAPVQVELLRQTDAGTMSASTAEEKLDDSLAETLQVSATHTATVEPSAGGLIQAIEVHPQTGYEKIFPLGQEPIVGGGDRMGIRCTAPDAVNVRAMITWEE